MSRSLGDNEAKKLGVIAQPIIKCFPLLSHESFIVIASDGIWDVMSNEEVESLVQTSRE